MSTLNRSEVNWETWRPMDADSELTLGALHGSRRIFTVISKDFPEHGHHWVRSISRCLDGSLLVQCSCKQPYVIPK